MRAKHIVIGMGQIGHAIRDIFDGYGHDPVRGIISEGKFDIMHICFPYSESFVHDVLFYKEQFNPDLIIVHSTVPVGICDKLGVVHSPVRGIHPNLKEGILTFKKLVGGVNRKQAIAVMSDFGIDCIDCGDAKNTEAMKIWDTSIYGFNILLEKLIHKYCEENGLDFSVVYTLANQTYNKGYKKLNRPEYSKYVLKHIPGKIGGHCVTPNINFLPKEIEEIFDLIAKRVDA